MWLAMKNQRSKESLNDIEFKRIFGVKRETYGKMSHILENEFVRLHKTGGCMPKLSIQDKLDITLQYLREYRTMEHIGVDWGVRKSTISDTIKWVENTLIKDGTFKLPGKKVVRAVENEIEYVIVDVTESPIERPQKNNGNTTPARKSGIP
jgi:hypothetical protein